MYRTLIITVVVMLAVMMTGHAYISTIVHTIHLIIEHSHNLHRFNFNNMNFIKAFKVKEREREREKKEILLTRK